MPRFSAVAPTLSWARPDTWYRLGRLLRDAYLVVLVIATPVQIPEYRESWRDFESGAEPESSRSATTCCHLSGERLTSG
jgi:hypothetical protein